MRIRSIKLQNFQAHKNLKVEFSPHITTIKGPSDRGKSSILRALRWICLNDLGGTEFIREGENFTQVQIEVLEMKRSYIVERKKGGRENTYALNETVYMAFGPKVPQDISSLLQLNEINFQDQHDSPFWFQLTAGEVSRRLNAVIDLSIIDRALANIASRVRSAQERLSAFKELYETAKQKYDGLELQRLRIAQFQRLQERFKAIEKLKEEEEELQRLIESVEGTDVGELRKRSEAAEELFVWARRWKRVDQEHYELTALVREIIKCEGQLKSNLAKTLEAKFHEDIRGTKCPLCESIIE